MIITPALNGIINVRTAFPGIEPKTQISLNSGFYMNPARKELIWRDQTPVFGACSFSHSRIIGNMDIVVGGMAFNDPGYKQYNFEERYRGNFKIRYRDKKVKGLSYGINGNYMNIDVMDFFLWIDADSGALKQNPNIATRTEGSRFNIDPYIVFYQEIAVLGICLSYIFFGLFRYFRPARQSTQPTETAKVPHE